MPHGPCITRRRLIAGTAYGLAGGLVYGGSAGAQKIIDLRGLDPLWKTADDAIRAFFGPVTFGHEGIHLDLPEDTDTGTSVPLTIRIDAKMTEADYPKVMHVLAQANPSPHVLSVWLTPASGKAEISTRIRLERTQTVTVVAEMSDGRHLRADRDISVSFGACQQVGEGTNDDIFAFQPQSKVRVQPSAKRGEIVAVRALISHPMETGIRLDEFDDWVRQRIISRFDCTYGGKSVFHARLYPAIATNPYFMFYARAEASGTFDFSWYDMTDKTYTNQASITVT
jgi:sulfur-oxidizing protein SoxY